MEEGGSWVFAYHCGLCYEGGGQEKQNTPNNRGGFQKLQGEKSKIIIVPPPHKL